MKRKSVIFYLLLGLGTGLGLSFILIFAQSVIDFSKPGVSLWIYLSVAGFIVLLEIGPAIILITSISSLFSHPPDWTPVKKKIIFWLCGLAIGFIINFSIGWAKPIEIGNSGISFWIFAGIGLIIILLQVIPTVILFLLFVGYGIKQVHLLETFVINN